MTLDQEIDWWKEQAGSRPTDKAALVGATDLVYSPDDNGYYFSQTDFRKSKGGHRTSSVYPTDSAAKKAWAKDAVKWDDWY